MFKKLLLLIVLGLLLAAGGAYYLLANLDGIIKHTIETYGSAATQTSVSLSRVHLDVRSGSGELSGLTIGAPTGYQKTAIALGGVVIAVDPSSIMASTRPIIIRDVTIDAPSITYEMDASGGNNLQTIANNAKSYAATMQQKIGARSSASNGTNADGGRKIIIKHLVIHSAKLSITQPLLPSQNLGATLPDITLTDIGQATNGATPADVTNQLLAVFITKASAAAIKQMANPQELLKEIGNDALGKSLKVLLGH